MSCPKMFPAGNKMRCLHAWYMVGYDLMVAPFNRSAWEPQEKKNPWNHLEITAWLNRKSYFSLWTICMHRRCDFKVHNIAMEVVYTYMSLYNGSRAKPNPNPIYTCTIAGELRQYPSIVIIKIELVSNRIKIVLQTRTLHSYILTKESICM